MVGGRVFRLSTLKERLSMFMDYLTLRDYDRADSLSTDRIIKRQSRGSILAQNGWYISRKGLDTQSRASDTHIRNLRKAVKESRQAGRAGQQGNSQPSYL